VFQKGEREAIRLCLEHGRDALGREALQEFAERQVKSLRCAACHKRDGADDVMSALKDDAAGLEADLPPGPPEKEGMYTAEQVKPGLTYIGEKLRPEWMVPFLAGKIAYKPRPWLRSRMPGFPRRAELLGKGFAFEHGYSDSSPKPPKPDPKLADAGSRLASKTRWGCVSCHDVGKVAAVGVFEAPGVNFMYVTDRLRHPYYDRWLWNPLRLEPGTKMPQVYNVGQPSQIKDILGGDPQKQIDALWNYLLRADQIKPPAQ
jgi:mono/diheme cytochrome c family protein